MAFVNGLLSSAKRAACKPVQLILLAVAAVAFALGFIGIFVPGWPTTVFWIVAVACLLKSRPAMARPLLRTPVVGPAIVWYLRWRPFAEGGGLFSAPSKKKRFKAAGRRA